MYEKVLFVENFKIFNDWASKTYPYKCEAIQKDEKFITINNFDEEMCPSIKQHRPKAIVLGWHAACVNKYYTSKRDFYSKYVKDLETKQEVIEKLKGIFENSIPKYVVVQDMHDEDYENGITGFINYLKEYNITGIITPYYKTKNIQRLQKEIPHLKVLWLPHHIDHTKFKSYSVDKCYDILLFGNDHPKYYPFRHRIIKLLSNDQHDIAVRKLEKPRNYFKYNPGVSNNSLSKLMNKSWLTLCTSSNLDYLLGKYFETSFSGCTIVGNMATDGQEIWKDNYVNIHDKMSDSEIIETIKDALNNKEKLNEMSKSMQQIVCKNYKLCDFSQHLYDLL